MIWTLAAALLVAYVPGAILFRLPFAGRELRAALAADERVFWHVVLSVAWSLALVLLLAALGAYNFNRLVVINAGIALALLAAGRGGLLYRGAAARPSWSALLPVGLVAIGLWQYFPPSEYVMGGKDPGAYLNEGVQLAQRGSLVTTDPLVADVPPGQRDLFFPFHRNPDYYSLRFMGFWIRDPDAGTVVGQFPHLFPASVAVGYGLYGLSGAREAVGAWAMLGVVALYLVAVPLVGRAAAFGAALLLAVNIVQVWFARYPNSEHVMQALLLAASLAFARAREGLGLFGAIAGALLGLLLFLRYDVVLALAAFAAAWTLLAVTRERTGWAFVLLPIAFGLVALEYWLGLMRAYAAYPLGYTRDRGGWLLVGLAFAAIWLFRMAVRTERWAEFVRRWLPTGLAVTLGALAFYAYFLREAGGRTAEHDAAAFRHFAWYVTPWGLLAGTAGLLLLIRTAFWRSPALFLTIAAYSVFFFYKTRIVPEHFWTSRRFLAIALPAILLGAAALAAAAVRALTRRLPAASRAADGGWSRHAIQATAVLLLLAPLAVAFWRAAAPVRAHVEYAGLIPRLEAVAGTLGDRDLVMVESRNASDTHVLALPLAYIYARQVLVLDNPRPDKQLMEAFLTWAATRYDRVLFMGGGGTDLLSRRMTATPLASWQFQIPEYHAPINAYPSGIRRKEFDFGLYQINLEVEPAHAPLTVSIGIGEMDELDVVRFHAKERHSSGVLFRWTRDVSYVLLGPAGADAREVTVWMSDGGRPAGAPRAEVEVAIEEHVIGNATADGELRPHTFAISPAVAEWMGRQDSPVRLRLRVPTWSPARDLGIASDPRELGVMVTQVEVR
jgi:hypothetical protein